MEGHPAQARGRRIRPEPLRQSGASPMPYPFPSAQALLADVELRQEALAIALGRRHRAQLGQFFTPALTARFIASMLGTPERQSIRVLDPGAGIGILCAAAVVQLVTNQSHVKGIELVAYELDARLDKELRKTLIACERFGRTAGVDLSWELRASDYVADVGSLFDESGGEQFDVVIMNPPYRKIRTDSNERAALEAIGLRVSNLYTAFLALAAAQLRPRGVLSAITPRSFANGLYHEPFRRFFFERIGVDRLHVFESRGHVFANADVLQENIIIAGTRGTIPSVTTLSVSYGAKEEPRLREVPYAEIIHPGDQHQFLRIPTADDDAGIAETMVALPVSVGDLGIIVSTGRVVDFRAKEYLRPDSASDTVPLIYPGHLRNRAIAWPAANGGRKPNALQRVPETLKLLLPNETYVLVKRFTAKEERRRVVAAVISAADVPGDAVAIENHLNVYHDDGRGLQPDLAHGLAAYLNSSFVDRYVRQFSGHTQINATDLRHLRYPSRDQLCTLGALVRDERPEGQEALDHLVEPILAGASEHFNETGSSDMAVVAGLVA
jgi:adenine-specific DNA-methyltransferase